MPRKGKINEEEKVSKEPVKKTRGTRTKSRGVETKSGEREAETKSGETETTTDSSKKKRSNLSEKKRSKPSEKTAKESKETSREAETKSGDVEKAKTPPVDHSGSKVDSVPSGNKKNSTSSGNKESSTPSENEESSAPVSKRSEKKGSVPLEKSRVWEIQSLVKDKDGNDLFTPEMVEKYLAENEHGIEKWCWVIHDRDKYTEDFFDQAAMQDTFYTDAKLGETKPAHIHLALQFYNPVHCSAIAKDIGLPVRYVQKAKAKRNQFIAIAAYLTHEDAKQQELGKARYYDHEIHRSSDFDYRKEVDNYFAHRKMFNSATMPRARVYELIEGVANGDLSLRDIKTRYGFAFFLEYEQKFLKAYREYIKMAYEMQPRINIFIEGPAGRGKSSLAVEVAKALYPKPDESAEVNENDMYYVAGKRGVRFDDYGYQPTIIWDDVRSAELLSEFGREGILNLFEIYPKKVNYNIKFGGIILVNQVNIFTGIEDYRTFLDGLMKGYKDKSGKTHDAEEGEKKFQSYRRMAMVLSVHQDFFEIKLNKALFSNGKPNEFETYARVGLDIYSLNRHFTGDAKKRMLEDALKPVKEKVEEYRHLNQTEYKITGKEINAQPIEIITDKDELKELEEKDRERYASYAKAYAEMEKKSKGDKALLFITQPPIYGAIHSVLSVPQKSHAPYPMTQSACHGSTVLYQVFRGDHASPGMVASNAFCFLHPSAIFSFMALTDLPNTSPSLTRRDFPCLCSVSRTDAVSA